MPEQNIIDKMWNKQVAYNQKIRAHEHSEDYEYWMKQYLLGAVSEIDEVLNEIKWKIHRRGKPVDRTNLARELADLTKYVFSMWEWSGFSWMDMLKYVLAKTSEMESIHKQEMYSYIAEGAPVVITDIDGTIGNYRLAFYNWLQEKHSQVLPEDTGQNLAMEIDLGMPYNIYAAYKEEFEAEGGYRYLQPYPEIVLTMQALHMAGTYILAYTARPAQRFSRIWSDTHSWLIEHGLSQHIQELHIGQEARIGRACELLDAGHRVVMLEDDPTTAIRAAAAGVFVFLRDQSYNVGVSHERIQRVDEFMADEVLFTLKYTDLGRQTAK